MNLVNSLDSTLCIRLALVLCHFLWQGLVIAALAAACSRLLRRASPQSRYWVYLGALALMAACLPATYLVVAWAVPAPPAVAIAPVEIEPQPLDTVAGEPVALPSTAVVAGPILPAAMPVDLAPPVGPLAAELPLETGETAWFPWEQAAKYATLAYLCGATLMLVRLVIGLRGGQRLRRDAQRVEDPALLATLRQQAQRLGLRALPAIATCRRVATPVVVGILRPMILLPVSFATSLTAEQAAIVLTHELAHIRRYDHLLNLLQRAVEAVLFFHPAVWYVSRRASVERENCCDDMVLASGAEPFHYAESLLRIAELSFRRRPGLSRSTAGVLAASGRRPSQLRLRILRLLGGSQGPEVRLTRLGLAGIIVTLALLATAPVLVPSLANPPAETTEAAEEKPAAESPYNHFLYVRHNEKGSAVSDSLVLAKITPEGVQQRDIFTQSNLADGWQPLCVINGWAYEVESYELIAINLQTGAAEKFGSHVASFTYDSGRLYAITESPSSWVSTRLHIYDLASRAYRDIALADVRAHSIERLAVSPDRRRLAFFNPVVESGHPVAFRLNVVDCASGEVKRHPTTVFAQDPGSGGRKGYGPGPTFVWLDSKTILLVSDLPDGKNETMYIGVAGGNGPDSSVSLSLVKSKVVAMDVATGQIKDVATLPQWPRRTGEPFLRPLAADGVPRIVLGALGQYRIDVQKKRLVEDNALGGEYRYVRGREPERLYYRDVLLAEAKQIPELSASPDGRRTAWLTGRGSPSELRYHDAAEGKVRTVAKGWFPANAVLWATADELAPTAVAGVPQGWQPLVASPYPEPPKRPAVDPRPDVNDLLTMTLATDKPAYAQHEQVQLTVTLTNKTDKDVSFQRPEPFSNRFGLVGTGPRVSGVIDVFDRTGEIFPADPVVLEAGANLRLTRPYEPIGIGEHVVWASPRLGDQKWQGRLKVAPIKFSVARSDREAELLKAKFDRFLKLCQSEFAKDPMTCSYGRFFDLDPEAVPLLAAAIEASDDPKFRHRLGYALARMATADALPYFGRLLAGDMKHDQEMVLEGLLTMVQQNRSPDRALAMLLGALRHPNAAVRRGAAARLRQIHDALVAAAFERAVEDSDAATAATAARYLAAYENLGLADWLTGAITKATHARYLAARSIVADLEKTWAINHGPLPAAPWKEASADAAAMEQYGKVLRAWETWARQNPRSSEHFFDEDRNLWQWTRDLQAEAAAKPGVVPIDGPPWKVVLPNGASVELIGLAESPSAGKDWWGPDGRPLAERPYFPQSDPFGGKTWKDRRALELCYRVNISGPGENATFVSVAGNNGMGTVNPLNERREPNYSVRAEAVLFPRSQKTTNVRIGAAAGPWKSIASGALDDNGAVQGFKLADGYGFLELKAPRKAANVVLSVVMDLSWDDLSWRFMAQDKAGTAHRLHENTVRDIREEGQPLRRKCDLVLEDGTKVSDLATLRLEVRRYQYAEFQNVPLSPEASKVMVVTGIRGEPPATPPPAERTEIERLLEQLGSSNQKEQAAAEAALVDIGARANAVLLAATKDANPERAERAKAALSRIEERLRLLRAGPEISGALIRELGKMDDLRGQPGEKIIQRARELEKEYPAPHERAKICLQAMRSTFGGEPKMCAECLPLAAQAENLPMGKADRALFYATWAEMLERATPAVTEPWRLDPEVRKLRRQKDAAIGREATRLRLKALKEICDCQIPRELAPEPLREGRMFYNVYPPRPAEEIAREELKFKRIDELHADYERVGLMHWWRSEWLEATLIRIYPDRADLEDLRKMAREILPKDAAAELLAMVEKAAKARQSATPPAPRPEVDAAEIARLIGQLGSGKSAEREDAQKSLVKIGLPAVAALQQAASDKDAERSKHAQTALNEIDDKAFGGQVDGFQIRLRPLLSRWKTGQTVSLQLQLCNRGQTEIGCPGFKTPAADCRIELDGQWYWWSLPVSIDVLDSMLKPGQVLGLGVDMVESWVAVEAGKSRGDCRKKLLLAPGAHVVRVSYGDIISNPVEVEIVPADATPAAAPAGEVSWGSDVDGVAVRLRPGKVVVEKGKPLALAADIRTSAKWKVPLAQWHCKLVVDDVTYLSIPRGPAKKPAWNAGGKDETITDIAVDMEPLWISEQARPIRPLQLSPGKHTIRLGVQPSPVKRLKLKPALVLSNPVEVEVTESGTTPGTQPAGAVELWRKATAVPALQFAPWAAYITVTADGKTLATTSGDFADMWAVESGKRIKRFQIQQGGMPRALALSPDGRFLAVGNGNVFAVTKEREVAKLELRPEQGETLYHFLQFTQDGSLLVAGLGRKVRIYQTRDWQLRSTLTCPVEGAGIGSIAMTPDARIVAIALAQPEGISAPGATEQALTVWDTTTGKKLLTLAGYRGRVALSPDGKLLAAVSANGTQLEVVAIGTGKVLHRLAGSVLHPTFSPDGSILAVAGPGEITLLHVDTYEKLTVLRGEFPYLSGLSFSRDGTMLLTNCEAQSLVWRPLAQGTVRVSATTQPTTQPVGSAGSAATSGGPMTAAQVAEYHRARTGENLSPDALEKLYTDQAVQFAQTGGDPHELEAAVHRAMAFAQDEATLVQLHVYLGDAYWRQTAKYTPEVWRPQRLKAAGAYLGGLALVLRHELPAAPPELPAVGVYNVDGPPEEVAKYRLQHEQEMAARKAAERVRELVSFRRILTGQLVQMYAREPDDFDQLHQIALNHFGSEEIAAALVAGAKAYRADNHAPPPVLAIPVAWGKPVNGLQAGLRFDVQNRAYQMGESVSFALTVRNTGDQTATLVYYVPLWGKTLAVRTLGGKPVEVASPPWEGPMQRRKSVLKPGDTLEVGTVSLHLDAEAESGWNEPHAYLTPGKYLVSLPYRFQDDPANSTWSGELTTGELTLSVAAAEGASDNKAPATPPAAPPAVKHSIGIYLVTGSPKDVRFDKVPLADLTLGAEALVTQDDISQYHWESHTIRMKTQAAADRVLRPASAGSPGNRFGGNFVLVVDGQRIYSGQKVWIGTSIGYDVPVIHTGPSADQFQPQFSVRIHPPTQGVPDPRGDARLKKALQDMLLMPKDDAPSVPAAGRRDAASPSTPDSSALAIVLRDASSNIVASGTISLPPQTAGDKSWAGSCRIAAVPNPPATPTTRIKHALACLARSTGSFSGRISDGVFKITLDPQAEDDAIRLEGVLKGNQAKGKWFYESYAGNDEMGTFAVSPAAPPAESGWGEVGAAGLQMRLVLLEQKDRKPPLYPEAWLEARNTSDRRIDLALSNRTGRKVTPVHWKVGLHVEVQLPDGAIRRYSCIEPGDETYWQDVRKPDIVDPIEPGRTARFIVNLRQLVAKDGARLSDLQGACQLRPVLEVTPGEGAYWSGLARGGWVPVHIAKKPDSAGEAGAVIFTAGSDPAPATPPAEAPWGTEVDGVKVRLRSAVTSWKAGQTPLLKADIAAEDRWLVPKTSRWCRLEVDGTLYYPGRPGGAEDIMDVSYADWVRTGSPELTNMAVALDDQWWVPVSGSTIRILRLTPGKHTIRLGVQPAPVDRNLRMPEKVFSNPVVVEITGDAKTAEPPAAGGEAAKTAQSPWGEAVDGLRCRWAPQNEPIVAGTSPKVAMEVENASPDRQFWQAASEVTWALSFPQYTEYPGNMLMPRFETRLGKGAREATAREVSKQFNAGRPDRKGDDPMPGYFALEPGGRMTVHTEYPWLLVKTGPAAIGGYLSRYWPVRNDNVGEESSKRMRCPPLVLQVKPGDPQAEHAYDILWGKASDGLQAGLQYEFGKRPIPQFRWPPLGVFLRNASDKPITFWFSQTAHREEPCEVLDRDGRKQRIEIVPKPDKYPLLKQTLAPGVATRIDSAGFAVRPKNHAGEEREGPVLYCNPGKYTVTRVFRYNLDGGEQRGKELTAGPIELDVTGEPAGEGFRRLVEAAKTESMEQAVRNLAHCYQLLMLSPEPPDVAFVDLANQDPRAAKLMKIARDGGAAERGALRAALLRECAAYLKDLPDFGEEGKPWKPSALHPGGVTAFPLLLRQCDPDAESLPMLVQMWLRNQEACRKYSEREGVKRPTAEKFVASDYGAIHAYACKHFLDQYVAREDLRRNIKPAQAKVIEAYKAYRDSVLWTNKVGSDQTRIMRLAVDFVEADIPWGEAVDGLQFRLVPDKRAWQAEAFQYDAPPGFWLEQRNSGSRPRKVPATALDGQIEVDGQLYWQFVAKISREELSLMPGQQRRVRLDLDGRLPTTPNGPPLAAVLSSSPGKHIIRARFVSEGKPVVSNPVEIEILPADVKPSVQTATGQVQTEWSAPQDGVQMRLRADKKTWRADEIPALRWDARNAASRQFLHVGDGQRLAQLEVDGVWHQWPTRLRSARQAALGAGQSVENQLLTVSPIWSRAKAEDLPWRRNPGAIVSSSDQAPPSLQLKPGTHTIRVAILIEPSRVDAGEGFRVVSQPLNITIEAPPAGQTSAWPQDAKLAQTTREALEFIAVVLENSPRAGLPEKEWIARALARTRQAAALAENTPLRATARQMVDALLALQLAVDKDSAGTAKEYSAVSTAYMNLVSVFAGETPPSAEPAGEWGKANNRLQVRLRAARTTWSAPDVPSFRLDFRSQGGWPFWYDEIPDPRVEVELDGQWFRPPARMGQNRMMKAVFAGEPVIGALQIQPDRTWLEDKTKRPLEFSPGRHTIRVAYVADCAAEMGALDGVRPVRVVSEAVEIVVTPPTAPPAAQPAMGTAWGTPVDSVVMRVRIDQVQWRPGQPPWRLLVDFRNNGAQEVSLPHQESGLEVQIDGQTFRWGRSHANVWTPLEPGSERTIEVTLGPEAVSWGDVGAVLAKPGRHAIRIMTPGPSPHRGGSPDIRVSTLALSVDVADGKAAAEPGAGKSATVTGQVVDATAESVAIRVSAPAGTEYQSGQSLPLKLELKNISAAPISLANLSWTAGPEVTDASGKRMVVETLSLGPWKTRTTPLQPGEALAWTERFECFAFRKPPAPGAAVTIRFRICWREPDRAKTGGTPPLVEVFSNPVAVTLKDAPLPKLNREAVPERWRPSIYFAYREDMGLAGWRRLQVDADGTARLARPAYGRKDSVVPWGQYEVKLNQEQLDRLAKVLREHRIWELSGSDYGSTSVDGGSISICFANDGQALVQQFPNEVFQQFETLKPLREKMQEFMAMVVVEAGKALDKKAGTGPWGEAVDGVQVRLRAEKPTWGMGETPKFRADVRSQGDQDLLLATVEGLGCELHFDGVKYRHPTDLTGVAYHNIKAWEHGFRFALHKQWTTIEGNKPLTLTPGKHTVRFAWAGCHYTTVDGGMVPDETRPVLLVSNPVEIEILAADAKPATQPDTNPGNSTIIDVHDGSVRIKSGDNTIEADRIVLESAAPPAAKKGVTVTGRVLDTPGGKGLPGATVMLWHVQTGNLRSTTTDKDGSYAFADVAPHTHLQGVTLQLPSGVWSQGRTASFHVGEAHISAADLYARTGQTVTGTIREATTGQPAGGARIDVNGDWFASDAQGRYTLYVLPGEVKATCFGTEERYYVPETEPKKSVTVQPGARIESVDFKVRSGKQFVGRVTLPNGKAAAGVDVAVLIDWKGPIERPGGGTRETFSPPTHLHLRLTTDAEGKFYAYFRRPRLILDPPLHYRGVQVTLAATTPDRAMGIAKEINADGDEPDLPMIAMELGKSASMTVRLADGQGKGIAGATFYAGRLQRKGDTYGMHDDDGVTTQHLGDGHYRMEGLVPGAQYHFQLHAPGYTSKRVYLNENSGNFRLSPGDVRNMGTMRLEPLNPPPATPPAAKPADAKPPASASQVYLSADGSRQVVYNDRRLVFYSDAGQAPRQLASVNVTDRKVIPSRQGAFLVLRSQFIGGPGATEVYDNRGRLVGQFELKDFWKATAVSDVGPLVALGRDTGEKSPAILKLCDARGSVLYESLGDPTHVFFTTGGRAVVWGVKGPERKWFASVLDAQGKVLKTRDYADKAMPSEAVASSDAGVVALMEEPAGETFVRQVSMWRPFDSSEPKIVRIDEGPGTYQTSSASLSANGAHLAMDLGNMHFVQVDIAAGKVIATDLAKEPLAAGGVYVRCLHATDDGSTLVALANKYVWLDRFGKGITGAPLPGFERYNSMGDVSLQPLGGGRVAIVGRTGNIVVADPTTSAKPPADNTTLDKEIEKESMEQAVHNLAHCSIVAVVSPSVSVEPLVHSMSLHPGVAKLLKIARDGAADERGALRTAILGECTAYLKDLPDFGEEGKPWKPSALTPGGGMAFPLILRQCDPDAESLPVLARMWLRHQDALRKHAERQGFKRPAAEWSSSDVGALHAYTCKYFLDQYIAREDLRRNIKPAQAKVLEAYKAYRDAALQTDKMQSEQTRIMRFAVDFVEAGTDKKGQGSRKEESGGARVTLLLDHNRTEYLLGENITVCYRLENVGKESIRYEPGGFSPASRLNDAYRVTAVPVDNDGKPIGQPLESWPGSTNAEGPMISWGFEPGKVSQQTLYLPRYVRFDKPGWYLIRIVNHPRGDLRTEFSASETTITLRVPTPEQAREIYQAMKKLPREPVAGIGERRDQIIADFEALIHPVYLPILLEYAQDGDADALDGLGNLHTMPAAEALISIVRRALEKDRVDLALAAYQHLGNPPEQPGTVGQTWRPEFAEPLRSLASRLAHDREPKALGDIAHIYMVLGTAKDLPDLTLAFSKAIEVTKTLPFETQQYFRPRGAVYSYRFAVPRLLERGARVSENPQTPSEAAAYMIALRQQKEFRPRDWPTQVVRWLGHETPYLREFVLEYLPEPVPEAALAMLPGLLADASDGKPDKTSQYVDLQIAACHAAKQHPREAFRQPLLNILNTGKEGHLLEAAAAAGLANGITTDRIMEIWLGRIDNSDLGGWAVEHLVLSILDDNWARRKDDLEPEVIAATRQRWSRFIQEHREQLRQGRRFKLGDPEITADLFPRGFQMHRDGKLWPPGNE